jgi:hypothetical protein
MKSIRLNKTNREEILVSIKKYINKKYEITPIQMEYKKYCKEFSEEFKKNLLNTYSKSELSMLQRFKLGRTVKTFSISKSKGNHEINASIDPFKGTKGILITFDPESFIPISKESFYGSYSVRQTIINIIENDQELMKQFKLIEKIHCDIGTEMKKLLSAYSDKLYEVTTTGILIKKYPFMEKFISVLDTVPEEENMSDDDKLLKQFETEEI